MRARAKLYVAGNLVSESGEAQLFSDIIQFSFSDEVRQFNLEKLQSIEEQGFGLQLKFKGNVSLFVEGTEMLHSIKKKSRVTLGFWKRLALVSLAVPACLFLIFEVFSVMHHFVPHSADEMIGEMSAESMAEDYEFCEDQDLNRVVVEMVEDLGLPTDRFSYTPRIIISDETQAYALPGGNIYVFSGLLEKSDTPDPVVGVLAHEMAHVERRHSMKRVLQSIGSVATMQLLLGVSVDIGHQLVSLKYSRDAEREADMDGVGRLHNIGVSAKGLKDFFSELEGAPELFKWVSTHPTSEERSNNLNSIVATESGKGPYKTSVKWNSVKDNC